MREQSELGDWETVFAQPDPRLREHVYGYQGFVETATRFVHRRELPFVGVALIINFGADYRLFNPHDGGVAPQQIGTFVAGPSDTHTLSEATGPTYGVEVRLTPIGAYLLLGLPMGEIATLWSRSTTYWVRPPARWCRACTMRRVGKRALRSSTTSSLHASDGRASPRRALPLPGIC